MAGRVTARGKSTLQVLARATVPAYVLFASLAGAGELDASLEKYGPNAEPWAVAARDGFQARCGSSGPRLVWPEGERNIRSGRMMGDLACSGELIKVVSDGRVTSPGDGFVRVLEEERTTTIWIDDSPETTITVMGAFQSGVDEGGFVLAEQPIARFSAGQSQFICFEVRDCTGTLIDAKIFIWEKNTGTR